MSGNFLGNFKVMGALIAVVIFLLMMYGWNRAEKKKLVDQGGAHTTQPTQTVRQQQAMQAYKRPNIGKPGGCGCGKK